MAVAALVVYGIFLVLTVGVRVAIQIHRTGATGIHSLGGRPGSPESLAGILFAIGILGAPVAPILSLLGVLDPISALDTDFVNLVGLVLAGSGVLLVFWAQLAMGDSWRIGVDSGERTELVTDGPFRVVRNPIFAATIPATIGFALMVPSIPAFVDLAVIGLALELQVRVVEEPYLLRTHGKTYRDYAARVGRFAPGVGRISAGRGQ